MSELTSKLSKQFADNFDEKLIVDNFAGGGGASTGIYLATGRHPNYAINHNPEALAIHKANHPTTIHIKTDIWEHNPRFFVHGRRVKFVWFSPDCTNFSKAKGKTPVKKSIRGLAWITLAWGMVTDMQMFMLENVEEFTTWGPVMDVNGETYPDPTRKGETFDGFIKALTTGIDKEHPALAEIREFLIPFLKDDYDEQKLLNGLGYKIEYKERMACDDGAPTSRKRFFLIARRDGRKIVWPEATYGSPKNSAVMSGKLKPWKSAADCIDWSIPTNSIFMSKEEAKDKKIRVQRPLSDSTLRRIARGAKKFVFDTETPYLVPHDKSEMAMLNTYYGGEIGQDRAYGLNEPIRTITADGLRHSLVTAKAVPLEGGFIAKHYGGGINGVQAKGSSLQDPLGTITAQDHNGLIKFSMIPFIKRDFGKSIGADVAAPLPTITSDGGGKASLVTANLITIDHVGGEAGELRIDKPLSTVTSKARHALVAAHAIKMKGTNYGYGVDEPTQTITANGLHHGVVETYMIDFYGNGRPFSAERPLPTQTTKDRFAIIDIVCDKETKEKIQAVRDFLAEYASDLGLTEKQMLGIVTIDGIDYQITDIKMRMLTPRELFTAQGFPKDYVIDPIVDTPKGKKKLSQSAQVRAVGNSVSPIQAAALIRANWDSDFEEEVLGVVA